MESEENGEPAKTSSAPLIVSQVPSKESHAKLQNKLEINSLKTF